MKKVVILFGGWLEAPNGAAYVVNSLVKLKDLFKQNGIEIESWTLDNTISRSFDEYKGGKTSVYKRFGLRIKSKLKSFISKRAKSSLLFANIELFKGFRIAELVGKSYAERENEDRIVFVHDLFTCYYYLKNRKSRNKVFLVLHNNGDTYNMLLNYYPVLKGSKTLEKLKRLEDYVLKEVDLIGFVAKNPKKNFIKLHPEVDPGKVTFVYNGLNDIEFNEDKHIHNPIEICCVGSITYRKGQDIIVDALSSLSNDERSKLHITFVGDGSMREELENKANQSNLPITFVGYSKDPISYLQKSDIFILPSRDEGFPISILEAMREGLPVISTDIAGIPEMVFNDVNGLIINPNVDSLSKVLKNISEYNWSKFAENSRKLFQEKFTLSQTVVGYSYRLHSL